MNVFPPAVLVLNLIGSPSGQLDFNSSLDSARDAFEAGDLSAAIRFLDYARQVAQGTELEQFLPKPQSAWRREIVAYGLPAVWSSMYSGVNGSAVKAEYLADGTQIEITLISEQLMLNGLMLPFDGSATIGGQMFMQVEGEDLLHARIGRVIVWITGTATMADKTALIEQMDFQALEAY